MNQLQPTSIRLWILSLQHPLENDPNLLNELTDPNYKGKPERVIRFHVEAWDVNCPEHIKPRFDEQDTAGLIQNMKNRIAELEVENAELRTETLAPS